MVLFNYATKELTAKVVYYGPGLCGKTTNLQYIYDTLPGQAKGKMLSLATKTDRTLFFDFLPIDLGSIRGMKTKIQLYTVPGQVFYDTTRKLVLKGADGVVFVADSQTPMLDANLDSFDNLITNLKGQNLDIESTPHVLQYNKRDMKNILSIDELEDKLNKFGVPYFEACALKGEGVFETLKGISKQVLQNLTNRYGLEEEKQHRPVPPKTSVSMASPQSPPKASAAKAPPVTAAPPKAQPAPAMKAPPAAPVKAKSSPPVAKPVPPAVKVPPPPSQAELEEIDFVEDSFEEIPDIDMPEDSIPNLNDIDDSEQFDLDDMEPLDVEELDDMAEIADLAHEEEDVAQKSQSANLHDAIEVPVSVNLPMSLAGKPLRLQISIVFEE